MLKAFVVHDPNTTILDWWAKAPNLSWITRIEFAPDLNILFGPNGSGKSAILTAAAELTFCRQGGTPQLNHYRSQDYFEWEKPGSWSSSWQERMALREDPRYVEGGFLKKNGIQLEKDSQPVFYHDPLLKPGLYKESHFDDDFFSEALLSMKLNSLSLGQQAKKRFERLMERIDAFLASGMKFEDKLKTPAKDFSGRPHDRYSRYKVIVEELLAGNIDEEGKPTLLLDEPERNMDFEEQVAFWTTTIPELNQRFQLIVATHCPFALFLSHAKYIEMEEGAVEKARKTLREASKGWSDFQ